MQRKRVLCGEVAVKPIRRGGGARQKSIWRIAASSSIVDVIGGNVVSFVNCNESDLLSHARSFT